MQASNPELGGESPGLYLGVLKGFYLSPPKEAFKTVLVMRREMWSPSSVAADVDHLGSIRGQKSS